MTLTPDNGQKWLCLKCLKEVVPEVKVVTVDVPISGDLYSCDRQDYVCPNCGKSFGTLFSGRLPDRV